MAAKNAEASVLQYFTLNFPCDWDVFSNQWRRAPLSPLLEGLAPDALMGARQLRLLLHAMGVYAKASSGAEIPAHAHQLGWDTLVRGFRDRTLSKADLASVADVLAALNEEDFSDRAGVMARFAREFELLKSKVIQHASGSADAGAGKNG